MKINIFIPMLVFFSAIACAQDTSTIKLSNQEFDNNLKQYLFTKYDDFQIAEIFSKNDDKKSFLKKTLGDDFVNGAINIVSREILFKALSAKTETHIGIAVLTYSNEQSAISALNTIEKSSYFENTKILTKYTARNEGRKNVVLYTESSADKLVLEFIGQYFVK